MPTKQKRTALAPTVRRNATTAKASRPRSTRHRVTIIGEEQFWRLVKS